MDFTSVLDRHRIEWHASGPKTHEGWVNFKCPKCGKDPYMGYNLAGGYCSCWSCGYCNLVSILQLLTNLPRGECLALAGTVPRGKDPPALRRAGVFKAPAGVGPLGGPHAEYLLGRGFIPKKVAGLWGVRGIAFGSPRVLRWRLYLPITYRGEVVSWTTRSVVPNREPRYFSATDGESSVPFRNLLYGVDHCRNSVIVCEGPMDAIAVGPGAVAVMGSSTSKAQMEQLSRFPYRAVCFDAEPDAQARALRLCNDLSVFPGRTLNVRLETGKDAASCDKEELKHLRKLLA